MAFVCATVSLVKLRKLSTQLRMLDRREFTIACSRRLLCRHNLFELDRVILRACINGVLADLMLTRGVTVRAFQFAKNDG